MDTTRIARPLRLTPLKPEERFSYSAFARWQMAVRPAADAVEAEADADQDGAGPHDEP